MKVIVIGAGVVGFTIARKLSEEGQDVVIIEKDERRVREIQEALDVKVVLGSGSNPRVLKDAGIEHVDMVIAVTDSDEVNMVASLIADTQTTVPKKIARIRSREYLDHPAIFEKENLDLDLNINPEKAAAERIIRTVEVPGAVEVVDLAGGSVKLVGCRLSPQSALVGKTPPELKEFYPEEKLLIVAMLRGSEAMMPSASTLFAEGDLVFAVTPPENAGQLLSLFGAGGSTGNRVMIVGGGDVGFYLAEHLEASGLKPKVVERNEARCAYLAEHLDKTIVLSGDGTDQTLLAEENVSEVDTFIAVTDDEEANILCSLLAKRLGAKRCVALIDKPEYLSMVTTIGIDVAVSPRLTSVSGILQFLRRGKVLSVTALLEGRVEALETIAMETADIVERQLREIDFPEGALIGAVIRDGEVTIPDGYTVISPGDGVIIFALKETIPKVEKLLMVKPEFF